MKNDKHYVIRRDGSYSEYDSFEHLISCISTVGIGNNFNDTYTNGTYYYDIGHAYERVLVDSIVMDSLNRVIQTYILEQAIEEQREPNRKHHWWYWHRAVRCKNYPGFRNGPIPFTGRCNRYRTILRYPRTRQELVANCYDKDFSRGRRGKKYLPTVWDDVPRSNHNSKSWKNRKRKSQWSD